MRIWIYIYNIQHNHNIIAGRSNIIRGVIWEWDNGYANLECGTRCGFHWISFSPSNSFPIGLELEKTEEEDLLAKSISELNNSQYSYYYYYYFVNKHMYYICIISCE